MKTVVAIAVLVAACLLSACASIRPTEAHQDKVVEAVRLMYVAAANDDLAQFHAVTTPDFYTFDGGRRMTGDELMALVKKLHTAGDIYVWKVTEPQVYIDGTTAWITYVNQGSRQNSTGKLDLTWLESAVLRKDKDDWRIHFFHSTRVASK